jgi:hypothetical protein
MYLLLRRGEIFEEESIEERKIEEDSVQNYAN